MLTKLAAFNWERWRIASFGEPRVCYDHWHRPSYARLDSRGQLSLREPYFESGWATGGGCGIAAPGGRPLVMK
jgi:hypothetical protein